MCRHSVYLRVLNDKSGLGDDWASSSGFEFCAGAGVKMDALPKL